MWKYLLVEIPQILYEPIAVFGLVGMVYALLRNIKNHDKWFLIIVFSLLIMLGWRLALHPLMVSSRYSSVLLFPFLIFSSWFAFQVKEIILCEKFLHLSNIRIISLLPFICISVLAICCLIKNFRYNLYADYTVKICKALNDITRGQKVPLCATTNANRIAYYAGYELNEVEELLFPFELTWKEQLQNKIRNSVNCCDPVYCIFHANKGEDILTAESFGITHEMGKWEILHREYTSKKKNKEMILARFIPEHPNIDKWIDPVPKLADNNFPKHADFETGTLDLPWLKIGAFPESISISQDKPLAGNYSLRYKVEDPSQMGSFYFSPIEKPNKRMYYSFFVRNNSPKNEYITVQIRSWNTIENQMDYLQDLFIPLPSEQLFQVHGVVQVESLSSGNKNIYPFFFVHGDISFDNFSIRTE